MSLILLEGCDDGLLSERWVNANSITATPAASRHGAVIDYTSFMVAERSLTKNLLAADEHATLTMGVWLYLTGMPSGDNRMIAFVSDAGTIVHGRLYVTPTGQLEVSVPGGTFTSDIVWGGLNTAHYIELQMTLHDTAGAFTVWSDGVVILSQTGIDTKAGGTKTVYDQVRIEFSPGGSDTFYGYMGDIYITNGAGAAPYNGRLGDIIVDTIIPNANGTASAFVGSDGDSVDNYLLVDELPSHDGDTTYVESSVDTDRDSYGFSDLAFATGAVLGVVVTAVARNIGTADNCQISARIGGSYYNGSTLPVPTGYNAQVRDVLQVSPATGADWTIAEVNAAEFGIENVV